MTGGSHWRCALALAASLSAACATAELAIPRDAPYVLADGSIYIVGEKALEPVLTRWNEMFSRAHPGVRFTMLLRDAPVGIDGIIARVSLFAPVAHDAWESEIDPFKRLNGYRPLDIRVGRIGHAGPGRRNPPAIYVNAANPVAQLTIDEVGRILTAGQIPADLRRWSQVGLGGEWGKHAIHAYGTRDDGETLTALRLARFGGRPFARNYEALATDADVLEALSGDRYGIGLVWSTDAGTLPKDVKLVPLSAAPGRPPSSGAYDDVRRGSYPLSPHVHIYVASRDGASLDPVAREYLRLALSPQGQRVIEEMRDAAAGLVPLDPEEAARELARLN